MLGLQQTRNVNPILLYCCPASQTMDQHYNNIGRTSPVCWELVNVLWRTRNIHLIIARTSVRAKSSQRPEWGCWTGRPMLQDVHLLSNTPPPPQPAPALADTATLPQLLKLRTINLDQSAIRCEWQPASRTRRGWSTRSPEPWAVRPSLTPAPGSTRNPRRKDKQQ